MKNDKIRICSIDLFRYLCAIMVVAIHTHPLEDISDSLGYIATDVLPRIGVPFFLAVAGYFYIQKLENGEKPFSKYIKRLTVLYFVWSIPYYLIDFLQWGHSDVKGFLINCVYTFFYTGSHYHFWFFPAVIYAVILTTIIWKLKCQKLLIPFSMLLYIVGCLGCSYYKIGIHIPVLSSLYLSAQFTGIRRILMMGFPFFVSGYAVCKINAALKDTGNRSLIFIWCAAFLLWIAEIVFVIKVQWQDNVIITIGLYLLLMATLLLLVRNPMPRAAKAASGCRLLANFTYYLHPLFISLFSFCGTKFFGITISQTPLFLLTVIITALLGLCTCRVNHRTINWLFK